MRGFLPCVAREQYEKEPPDASSIHHCGDTSRAKRLDGIHNVGTNEERESSISNSK